jgi:hypothetical protein
MAVLKKNEIKKSHPQTNANLYPRKLKLAEKMFEKLINI